MHCGEWRRLDGNRATGVCVVCGDSIPWQDEDVQALDMIYNGTVVNNRQRYAYKRISHFRIWLDRLEGRDEIPSCVLALLTHALGELPIKRPSSDRIRAVLREIGKPRYYNSIPAIRRALYNEPPERLSAHTRADIELSE